MLTRRGSTAFWTLSTALVLAGTTSAVLAFRADDNTRFIVSMLIGTVGVSMALALPILTAIDRRRARRENRRHGFEVIR